MPTTLTAEQATLMRRWLGAKQLATNGSNAHERKTATDTMFKLAERLRVLGIPDPSKVRLSRAGEQRLGSMRPYGDYARTGIQLAATFAGIQDPAAFAGRVVGAVAGDLLHDRPVDPARTAKLAMSASQAESYVKAEIAHPTDGQSVLTVTLPDAALATLMADPGALGAAIARYLRASGKYPA